MSSIRRNWSLVDRKDELMEQWSKDLLHYAPLQRFNLTAPQRRVIASLKWEREVARSNVHITSWEQQPPPVMGYDERNRIVVQKIEHKNLRCWAVARNGDPADITGIVRSLKDDRIVRQADSKD